jgi:hypothetical protein
VLLIPDAGPGYGLSRDGVIVLLPIHVSREPQNWWPSTPTHGSGKWTIIPSMDMMYLVLIYLGLVRSSLNGKNLLCRLLTRSTDRLPTIQASQALNELQRDNGLHLSTGLEDLDKALLPPSPGEPQSSSFNGGVKRGQVTEIWGPPGTGKTAIS